MIEFKPVPGVRLFIIDNQSIVYSHAAQKLFTFNTAATFLWCAFEIDPDVLKILPKEVVSRHQVIPVNRSGNTLIIAMSDPSNIYAIDDVKFITNFNVEVVVASDTAFGVQLFDRLLNRVGIGDHQLQILFEHVPEFVNPVRI